MGVRGRIREDCRHGGWSPTTLTVNNLAYAQPVFSLGWLWVFTTIEVGNPGLVMVGTIGVLTANALSNPNFRYRFRVRKTWHDPETGRVYVLRNASVLMVESTRRIRSSVLCSRESTESGS